MYVGKGGHSVTTSCGSFLGAGGKRRKTREGELRYLVDREFNYFRLRSKRVFNISSERRWNLRRRRSFVHGRFWWTRQSRNPGAVRPELVMDGSSLKKYDCLRNGKNHDFCDVIFKKFQNTCLRDSSGETRESIDPVLSRRVFYCFVLIALSKNHATSPLLNIIVQSVCFQEPRSLSFDYWHRPSSSEPFKERYESSNLLNKIKSGLNEMAEREPWSARLKILGISIFSTTFFIKQLFENFAEEKS